MQICKDTYTGYSNLDSILKVYLQKNAWYIVCIQEIVVEWTMEVMLCMLESLDYFYWTVRSSSANFYLQLGPCI